MFERVEPGTPTRFQLANWSFTRGRTRIER
jgi:hypothetical protein